MVENLTVVSFIMPTTIFVFFSSAVKFFLNAKYLRLILIDMNLVNFP